MFERKKDNTYVLSLASEPSKLDHGQSKLESILLSLLNNLLVQLKARHVLRSGGRDKPSIVANGQEDANSNHIEIFDVGCDWVYSANHFERMDRG